MDQTKSLDEVNLIAALLHDAQKLHEDVLTTRDVRLDLNKILARSRFEGISFLTKTLPRLGKAFDKALSDHTPLNAVALGFKPQSNSKLPKLFGKLFNKVLSPNGTILQDSCPRVVATIRLLTYLFYKYELPYEDKEEQKVIDQFIKTEDDLKNHSAIIAAISSSSDRCITTRRNPNKVIKDSTEVTREAKILLSRLFSSFDPTDIIPRHGPGAVAIKQKLWAKFDWTNISSRITDVYPLDAYFYASLGHVCDSHKSFSRITELDLPAQVILVPKDSRGPRLISCEPVDFQWIQQGLASAIVRLVESHPLTRYNIHFTDQLPNQLGALLGSKSGKYSTLDLKEASDRISVDLVRLLFPEHISRYLLSCRSLSTKLPSGDIIQLNKFAPMGSALCFPVLALVIWSILTASARDSDARESILVYGDDVIVRGDQTPSAIEQLETFGLAVNRDKSCTGGFFRESCGMDAFKGVCVTPVRIRTVWSSTPSPESYSSWIAYANSLYDRKYYTTYDLIVSNLIQLYGRIPSNDMNLSCPSLREVPDQRTHFKVRTNIGLQKRQYYVWDVVSRPIKHQMPGWSMLLRYFTECQRAPSQTSEQTVIGGEFSPFSEIGRASCRERV